MTMNAKIMTMAIVAALASGVALADGAQLYQDKTCWSCHGKDGKKTLMPDYPRIAGQNVKYVERQMLDIKSGARANGNAAAMKGVMGLVTEAEIKELAEYVASLKP